MHRPARRATATAAAALFLLLAAIVGANAAPTRTWRARVASWRVWLPAAALIAKAAEPAVASKIEESLEPVAAALPPQAAQPGGETPEQEAAALFRIELALAGRPGQRWHEGANPVVVAVAVDLNRRAAGGGRIYGRTPGEFSILPTLRQRFGSQPPPPASPAARPPKKRAFNWRPWRRSPENP